MVKSDFDIMTKVSMFGVQLVRRPLTQDVTHVLGELPRTPKGRIC